MIDISFPYNPSTDIPSLEGKVILITGANTGLGRQTTLELAKHNPAQIWMTARSPAKGQAAVDEVNTAAGSTIAHFLRLDLSSFSSIKTAAKVLLSSTTRLDIVFLNAGIFGHPPALTEDGYEIHIGTNHLGHALLIKFLTPLLLQSSMSSADADIRVVVLTSIGYKNTTAGTVQFTTLKSLNANISPAQRYCQSKLANMLYAKQLAQRVPQLTVVPIHPGEVMTELFGREPGDEQIAYLQREVVPKHAYSVEEGVKNQLWAATTARENVKSGEYYEPVGVSGRGTAIADDQELAGRLWEWTETELAGHDI